MSAHDKKQVTTELVDGFKTYCADPDVQRAISASGMNVLLLRDAFLHGASIGSKLAGDTIAKAQGLK